MATYAKVVSLGSDEDLDEIPHTRILRQLDRIFEGRLSETATTTAGSSVANSPSETLTTAAVATRPNPTRILLDKVKELCERIAWLEERDRQRVKELAMMRERVDKLACQCDVWDEAGRRLDDIEKEMRHLDGDIDTSLVGEQTQQELYNMYMDAK
ncbi:hypothetical protein TRAPUB_4296 [Trametes pubescens]|uniref:Uncharacterized protein n=1 Tax=Trametes pubescens TaxID=154538 RepID=A0A1M2VBL4_TRAPU|nr:hypothetical protein TRAPUB_4296 [Trametes pubescens]